MRTQCLNWRRQLVLAGIVTAIAACATSQLSAGVVGYGYNFRDIGQTAGSIDQPGIVVDNVGRIGTFSTHFGTWSTYHDAYVDSRQGSLKALLSISSDNLGGLSQFSTYFEDVLYFTAPTAPPPPPPLEGPFEGPGGPIPQYGFVSMNYRASGRMEVEASLPEDPDVAIARINFAFDGNPSVELAFARLGSVASLDIGNFDYDIDPTGRYRAGDVTLDGESSGYLILSGQPVTMRLSLDLLASANNRGNVFLDFMHTVTFPSSGPVFNLPTGWSVNSQSGSIVNNQFVGLNAVPEPSSVALFGCGALGLLLRNWRKRKSFQIIS
jgi:hypothetical protein